MKKLMLLASLAGIVTLSSCKKDKAGSSNEIPSNLPRTQVPAAMQGMWMYGNFSTTEFWSTDPATYLGNALTLAFAFKFNEDGSYEQYFASSSVVLGSTTYLQSFSRGTLEIDHVNHTITTHPFKAHYKKTGNSATLEERDLRNDEIHPVKYYFEEGTEPNGTKALYMKIDVNEDPLTCLQK